MNCNKYHGVIILDKPVGLRSTTAVNGIKHMLPRGTKVGHAGTLDPFATGVLLILVGKATRQCEKMMDHDKSYAATLKFGAFTDSDDPEMPEQIIPDAVIPAPEQVQAMLPKFIGTIHQTPPRFSALKVGGKRASDRVRAGETVTLAPRPVRIDSITIQRFESPYLHLAVDCGRGVYIRSLARELGQALGCGAYLTALRRLRVGEFHIQGATTWEQLESSGDATGFLRPVELK